MGAIQKTITPIDDSLYVERPYASAAEIEKTLKAAKAAQRAWKGVAVADRQKLLTAAVNAFVSHRDQIAAEITRQIGRPIGQSPGEVRGFEERARYMIDIAPRALADIDVGPKPTFTRFIRREPLG
ncbi:MAG: aldehyde dehydrogenase family protein, partial [Hypericibacter sp.]